MEFSKLLNSTRQILTPEKLHTMMLEWPLLVATVTQVLAQDEAETCTFTPDCKGTQCWNMADAFCKCNLGQCVSVGAHLSDWINPNITKDCDEGGYMDCSCKYLLYLSLMASVTIP